MIMPDDPNAAVAVKNEAIYQRLKMMAANDLYGKILSINDLGQLQSIESVVDSFIYQSISDSANTVGKDNGQIQKIIDDMKDRIDGMAEELKHGVNNFINERKKAVINEEQRKIDIKNETEMRTQQAEEERNKYKSLVSYIEKSLGSNDVDEAQSMLTRYSSFLNEFDRTRLNGMLKRSESEENEIIQKTAEASALLKVGKMNEADDSVTMLSNKYGKQRVGKYINIDSIKNNKELEGAKSEFESLIKAGRPVEAQPVFDRMRELGLPPELHTSYMDELLGAYQSAKDKELLRIQKQESDEKQRQIRIGAESMRRSAAEKGAPGLGELAGLETKEALGGELTSEERSRKLQLQASTRALTSGGYDVSKPTPEIDALRNYYYNLSASGMSPDLEGSSDIDRMARAIGEVYGIQATDQPNLEELVKRSKSRGSPEHMKLVLAQRLGLAPIPSAAEGAPSKGMYTVPVINVGLKKPKRGRKGPAIGVGESDHGDRSRINIREVPTAMPPPMELRSPRSSVGQLPQYGVVDYRTILGAMSGFRPPPDYVERTSSLPIGNWGT